MYVFNTQHYFSLSISFLSVKETENYINNREERDTQKVEQEEECIRCVGEKIEENNSFIIIQALFVFYFHKCTLKAQSLNEHS